MSSARRDATARAPGRLSDKRVLITGASSGIGLLAASAFAAEGARTALLARGGEALEQAVRDRQLDALVLAVDVTDRAAVERTVEDASEQLGGLDVVVANAAAGAFGHFLEVDADDFDRVIDVTFRGSVNVIRAALPRLRASHGTIVATGSLLSRMPMPSWSAYTAGKHALRGFLNSLAIEEREQRTGVRVAMVHPGVVDTPFWARASSGTGLRPRVPPDSYSARVVAAALVENAVAPRREVLLGSQALALAAGFALARPVAERVLTVADRWFRSGEEPAPPLGALWRATERAQASGGIPARESLTAWAQLGPRMRPPLATPLTLAAHLARVTATAVKLRGALRRPVPEHL